MSKEFTDKVRNLTRNSDIDCLLMFSGGKDSSYLLYFLSQKLGLKVATITLIHDFLSKETRENIEGFARRFSTRHFSIPNPYLNYAGRHYLESWIKCPDEGSLITLCTGCRLGLVKLIIDTAKKENINVVITGLTPFEATDYRIKLVNYPRGKEGKFFFLLGYLRMIVRNPALVTNIKALKYQMEEYYYYANQKKIFRNNGLELLRPFYDNLTYNESEIIETLKTLGWQKASVSTASYWRADCNMNAIRQFFHNRLSGYNEMEMYYGKMLKKNLIDQAYYDKQISDTYRDEDIMKLIEAAKLSTSAIKGYRELLAKKN